MCCSCVRVYWTVLHNLFVRFANNISNAYYSGYCCCCCMRKRLSSSDWDDDDGRPPNVDDFVVVSEHRFSDQHEYLVIPTKKIETEPYYRTVDRKTAEEILTYRDDGTCLVRPYKDEDISIKYVISIYARNCFFHLYIRRVPGTEMYSIGQRKPYEKLFYTPSDIIAYYRQNKLLCTNKKLSVSLNLLPIS